MLLPGLFAVFRQSPAALVALGVTAIGQAGLMFAGLIEPSGWTAQSAMTVPSPPRSGTLLAWLVIGILGVCALLLGVARARAAPESRRVGIALTAGALGALGLLAWLAVAASAVPGPVAARLHDAARAMPSAALALWGCAAALLLVPLPRARRGRGGAGSPRRHPGPRRVHVVRRSLRRRPASRVQSIPRERSSGRHRREPDPARQDRRGASRLPIGLAVRPAALGGPRGRGRHGRLGARPRADAGGRLLGRPRDRSRATISDSSTRSARSS